MKIIPSENLWIPPQNKNIKIWRYMDLPKFLDLLIGRALFFSRADMFEDPFEGSFALGNQYQREHYLRQIVEDQTGDKADNSKEMIDSFLTDSRQMIPKMVYISCWHMNDNESFAMWNIYSKDLKGIAIQSSYRKLESLLPEKIKIGVVRYIDYEDWMIPEDNLYSPFLFKRKSFEYECELRAMFMNIDKDAWGNGTWPQNQSTGIKLDIDVEELIENIYVAPFTENWIEELLRKLTVELGYKNLMIIRSPLEAKPYF